ncbi:MAG: Ca2+:H+ antiporter, partial [Gaiellaceae bacterium]|jgi:Ca2+:H+ antiporter|nr:Ca2+:H+ antiporter [Gaiellaceae bacterium]
VARRLLWAGLVLAPVTIVARFAFGAGDVTLFALAAASLIPLAWLIGESTEHAAEHTGPGIGGFLNASFGNAPELIIALFAINEGLPDVVRGSLAGSVASNILLVLGAALIVGGDAELDRRSLLAQLGLVALAVLAFLIPSVPAFHGNPDRRSLMLLTAVVSIFLLSVYIVRTVLSLRSAHRRHEESGPDAAAGAWTMRRALTALALATTATALVSEIMVHSLAGFAHAAGMSEFFISIVIVAVVGNAAEHGGAVVIASRGKMKLATEIAISSSAQVALLVAPAVALLSFAFPDALPLSFRPIELVAMGGAALVVAIVIRDGKSRRWEGYFLVGVYVALCAGFWVAGDR